ncbi:MAG: TPM domain-containing protein, partial [Desulfosalsimonas sp.]
MFFSWGDSNTGIRDIKKTILIIFPLLLITVFPACDSRKEAVPEKRPSSEQWCYDFAGVVAPEVEKDINDQGRGIKRAFDVDFVVAVVPDLGGKNVNKYALDMFSNWEIGRSTQGKKGILMLIAKAEQKIRIEIGYDLEHIYPDAYVGQTEDQILKEFLEQEEWGLGFLATIENFLYRIYNRDMQEEVRQTSSPDDNLRYYSQGAGAEGVFDFGAAKDRPLPDNYDQLRRYFSAQPTPELAFKRYMELCANAVKHNNDLTLFTELSNEFWENWKHTSGQLKQEARDAAGRTYFIREKGNHAVVFFPAENPEDLKKSPMYYLYKSEKGWQVDINTMTRSIRYSGPGYMVINEIFHPYSEIIMKQYNIVNGCLARWDDPTGYRNFFALGSGLYDENEPGFHIAVKYESKSSFKTGDSIISVNGKKPRDWKHLYSFFKDRPAGTSYEIELIRNGMRMTVTEKLIENPDGFRVLKKAMKTPRPWLGVYMVKSLDREWQHTKHLRDQGKIRYSSLCYISEVCPGSPADKAGLRPGDLIADYGIKDNNGEITPFDIIKCLYNTELGESINLTILRNLEDKKEITVRSVE